MAVNNARMFTRLMEIVKRSKAYDPILIDTIISQFQSGAINVSFSNILSASNYAGMAINLRKDQVEINPIRYYRMLLTGTWRSWVNSLFASDTSDEIEIDDTTREGRKNTNRGMDSYIAYIFSPLIAACIYAGNFIARLIGNN